MKTQISPLTEKEKLVLEFVENALAERGISPSYQEIRDHFGFASFNSVQNYLKQLQAKGYILIPPHQKRAIQILHSASAVQEQVRSQKALNRPAFSQDAAQERIPLLGKVAAGRPLEAFSYDEFIEVPRALLRNAERSFALRVVGQSMIEDGILDGDLIVVQKQESARLGETIVATVENESTVKRFYPAKNNTIELRPANSTMESLFYPANEVEIQGVVVGLLRKF